MPDPHPRREWLELFLEGGLDRERSNDVVRHLLEDCPECRAVTVTGWKQVREGLAASRRHPTRNPTGDVSPYSARLAEIFRKITPVVRRVADEKARALQLLARLLKCPPEQRLTLVRNSKRFQTWGLCDSLIDRSYETRFSDTRLGLELAEMAAVIAGELDPANYGARQIHDLEGRAWANLCNARRVASDLRGAEEALGKARDAFEKGTGDKLDRALLCRYDANLCRMRRQFERADRMHDRAVALYLECGENIQAARILSDKGVGALYAGETDRAISLFEEAMQLAEESDDRRLRLSFRHNLALAFSECDREQEAMKLLDGLESAYLDLGDRLSAARVGWIEGKIRGRLGQTGAAESALLNARDTFILENNGYDAALVSLDLAAVYADQCRLEEVRRLAQEMIPVFQSRDVHREALAALLIFHEAAMAETLTLGVLQRIADYLRKARYDPMLKFRGD